MNEPGQDDLEWAFGKRTKITHPYNYDPITTFKVSGIPNGPVYSDRFFSWWGYDKVRQKMQEHFGDSSDYWGFRSPEKIEAFLQDMMQKLDLKLLIVQEHCNQATGYPVWYFAYHDSSKDLVKKD